MCLLCGGKVAFDANRFAVCFNGLYKPGIKNDCILMSGGTADRGDLAVLSKEIPTGSGVHKLLPNLKNAGKCVNVIPLKDSQQSEVSVSFLFNHFDLCYSQIWFFGEIIKLFQITAFLKSHFFVVCVSFIFPVVRFNKLNLATLGHKQFWQSRHILGTQMLML